MTVCIRSIFGINEPAIICLKGVRRMNRKLYPTDLTDDQWNIIFRYLPLVGKIGRPREISLREIVMISLYGRQYIGISGNGKRTAHGKKYIMHCFGKPVSVPVAIQNRVSESLTVSPLKQPTGEESTDMTEGKKSTDANVISSQMYSD